MSNNNKTPQGWDKKGKLPDNWGRSEKKFDNVTIPGNSAKLLSKNNSPKPAEDKVGASDKARVGAGKLADIAKRAGEAAKNAAGSAVEYARSDEAKEKMNAAKSKAQSLASSAGSALSDLKDKTSETIGNIRSDAASKEEQISEVSIEESENVTVQDDGDKQEMTEAVSVYENHGEISVDSIETGTNEAVISEKAEISKEQTDEVFAEESDNAPVQGDTDKQEITETVSAYNAQGATEEKRAYPKSPAFANNRSARPAAQFRTPSAPTQEKSAASPVHEEKKSSPIFFVLIAVIAVLLVGSCAIGSVIFMISKKNIKDNSSSTSVSSEEPDDPDISETTEESGNTEKSQTTSESVAETTTTSSDISQNYTSEEISAMFSAYFSENPDPFNILNGSDLGYSLIDINDDGIQELLITQSEVEDGSPGLKGICNIRNNRIDFIWSSDSRTLGKLCEGNYIFSPYIYGQGHGVTIFRYSSDNNFEVIESIEYNASTGSDKALYNGTEVSQTEADAVLAKYKAVKFKTNALSMSASTPETTTSQASPLSREELGRMYNEFHIKSLHGNVSGGYIEDYNGDGIDDLVFYGVNGGYLVAYYKNGALEIEGIPNTFDYGYDDPLPGMKTQYYAWNELPDKCRDMAVSCGFTANKDFEQELPNPIGYVKTRDIDGTVNLRSAPSTNSDVLTLLPNGKIFYVVPEPTGKYGVYDTDGWYYISVNNNGTNYTGYISADYSVAWDNGI